MFNTNSNFDSQLASSVQRDFHRDAANYRLTTVSSNGRRSSASKLQRISHDAMPVVSSLTFLSGLIGLVFLI